MRRGQASFEFLMTYGWAFLILTIILSTFVYMGITNVKPSVPEKCLFDDSFSCSEVGAVVLGGNSYVITFYIVNTVGQEVSLLKNTDPVRITSEISSLKSNPELFIDGKSLATNTLNLSVGQKVKAEIKFDGNSEDLINLEVDLNYEIKKEGYFPRISTGLITVGVTN